MVTHLALSPDGDRLALGLAGEGPGGLIEVLSLPGTDSVAKLETNGGFACRGVAFLSNRTMAFAVQHEMLGNCELKTVDEGGQPERWATYSVDDRIREVVSGGRGQVLAVVGKTVEVWDVAAREVARSFEGMSPEVPMRANFDPSGRYLFLSGEEPGWLTCHDLEDHAPLRKWRSPTRIADEVFVSPDGRLVGLIGEGGQGAFLYDLDSGARVLEAVFHEDTPADRMVFALDGGGVVEASSHFRFDPVAHQSLGVELFRVACCAAASHAPVYAFGSLDGTVRWMREVG